MSNVIFVGAHPGKNDFLSGVTRLTSLLGLSSQKELKEMVKIITLLGFVPINGAFPLRVCSLAARSMNTTTPLVLLGQQVASCFGLDCGYDLLTWYEFEDGSEMAIFPHPSKNNRWWDNKENKAEAQLFLRNLFYDELQLIKNKNTQG